MGLVAAVGVLCTLVQRHRSFLAIAADHESRMVARMFPNYRKHPGREIPRERITSAMIVSTFSNGWRYVYLDRAGRRMTPDEVRASIWHEAMARKYREAAYYPCFPVMPDPPPPR
jgi:hypothetical protein